LAAIHTTYDEGSDPVMVVQTLLPPNCLFVSGGGGGGGGGVTTPVGGWRNFWDVDSLEVGHGDVWERMNLQERLGRRQSDSATATAAAAAVSAAAAAAAEGLLHVGSRLLLVQLWREGKQSLSVT
jgi:hypothetical protein